MVLHNLFFAMLFLGVHFAIYPYLLDRAKANLFIVLGTIYVAVIRHFRCLPILPLTARQVTPPRNALQCST